MKKRSSLIFAVLGVLTGQAGASMLFDFDNAPIHTSLPIDLAVGGILAHFSATGQGFSIQRADTLGFTPAGFAGLCVYPNSVFAADLLVSFSQPLQDISIMYAPEEYGCDSSARMRITGYMDAAFVATNTTTAPEPGTWPTGVLTLATTQPFNRVVIHYDAPPPTGGDWGPIFMADNMIVTPSTQTIIPTTTTLDTGIVISGTPQDMYTSDDVYYDLRPGIVLSSTQSPIILSLSGNAPGTIPSDLRLVVESHANQTNLRQTIEVYNFTTATYELADQTVLTTSDVARTVTIPNPVDHIGPGNEVRARLSYKSVGPILSYPWQILEDEATWRYTP